MSLFGDHEYISEVLQWYCNLNKTLDYYEKQLGNMFQVFEHIYSLGSVIVLLEIYPTLGIQPTAKFEI